MTQATLDLARRHHRDGHLAEAERAYREVLRDRPEDPDAFYGLALVLHARGQTSEGLSLLQRAVALEPERAEYQYNVGVLLGSLNRPTEAIEAFQKALSARPDFPEAMFNLASTWQSAGKPFEAIALYRKLLALHPEHAFALVNLGNALTSAGNLPEALVAFEGACVLLPDLAEAQFNRGNALSAIGRASEAIVAYQEAVRLRPNWPEALFNLGHACRSAQKMESALSAYRQLLSIMPNHVGAICGLASIHQLYGRFDDARTNDAATEFRRALELDPRCEQAYAGLGCVLFELGQRAEGVVAVRRAIALGPENPTNHGTLAAMLLTQGLWEEGWKEFEWRLAPKDGNFNPHFVKPQWDGSSAFGKTLLLYTAGAYGDAIQCVRYVPMAAERGARVVLECQPALMQLFKQIPGVSQLVARGEPLPEFDIQTSLSSLPGVFGATEATIPARSGYLIAPPDRAAKFAAKIPQDGMLKVGLVWAGRPRFADVRTNRLDLFAPLGKIPKVQFFSLQKGEGSEQKPPKDMNWIDITADIADFADAAGLMAHLDLLISVDTATVHLAGALGKPVWMLYPRSTDIPWLVDREDSPWYSTLRIFRQPGNGDWQVAISRMAEQLKLPASERARR